MTTNPAAVAAVVKMCWDAGAKSVTVFDRPTAPPRQAYTVSGIQEAVRKADGDMKVLSDRDFERIAIPEGRVLTSWPLLVDVFDADVMINMPCAKTHGLAGLTLSMKNLMGVMGSQRGLIHQEFTQKIVDVNTLIKPQLIVLDAYRLLFRNGPTGGGLQDVKMGRTCVAGTNQVSVDSYGATLFGMKRHRPRLRETRRRAGPRRRRPEQAHHREAERVMATREAAPARGVHRFRRVFQFGFLALFFMLLTLTVWPLGSVALGVFLGADPLIALNSAINGVWLWPGWLALAMLLLPLVAGRAFCGYVCPTGTIIETDDAEQGPRQALARRARPAARAAGRSCCSARWGSLLFASGAYLFFDPLATLTRTATILLYPLLDRLLRLLGDVAYLAPPLRPGVDLATGVLTGRLVFARPLVYGFQLAVLAMFSAMLAAVVARAAHVVPPPVPARRAARRRSGGSRSSAASSTPTRASAAASARRVCPMDAISPRLPRHRHQPLPGLLRVRRRLPDERDRVGHAPAKAWLYSPTRRAALTAGGLAALAGFFAFTGLGRRTRNPRLVRPPGGRAENELLALCTRCGQCMKVCPTNVLQPAVSAGGSRGRLHAADGLPRRLVRVVVQRVRQGVPDRRDPAAHARGEAHDRHRPRLHRPEPLHPVGRLQDLPRLPGAVPRARQGDRHHHRRGRRARRRAHQARPPRGHRREVHRLRRVRERVPGRAPSGDRGVRDAGERRRARAADERLPPTRRRSRRARSPARRSTPEAGSRPPRSRARARATAPRRPTRTRTRAAATSRVPSASTSHAESGHDSSAPSPHAMSAITTPSVMKMPKIEPWLAPIERMTPISRVDSSTLIVIVPVSPMTPTIDSSAAMITRNVTRMPSWLAIVSFQAICVSDPLTEKPALSSRSSSAVGDLLLLGIGVDVGLARARE